MAFKGIKDSPRRDTSVVLRHDDVKTRTPVYVRPRDWCSDAPPYKDSTGRWRTSTLFYETFRPFVTDKQGEQLHTKYTPIFTLREMDLALPPKDEWYERYETHIIPSLRQIYLSYNDPTEYTFSVEVFKSTYHWKHLQELKWFKPYVTEWRKTLAEKLKGIGVGTLVEIAQSSDPKFALAASKWLAEGRWQEHEKVGRPTKEKVAKALKDEIDVNKIYEEDARRMGIELLDTKDVDPVYVDSDGTIN